MKSGKLLVCLQTWSGDLAQADALARLLVDVTLHANAGQKSPHADFLLCVRWDTDLPMDLVRYCAKAFTNVRTLRCRNRISGWPAGPNNMAIEVYRYFVGKQESGVWNYSGLMLTEPDSIPLKVDCLARIQREWLATDQLVLGCWIGSFPNGNPDGSQSHINGNMVVSHELAKVAPGVLAYPTSIAWDAAHRKEIVPYAKPSMTIYSDYQLGDETKNPWRDCGHMWRDILHQNEHPLRGITYRPSWLHGVKDPRGLACARERLLRTEVLA